MRRTISADKTHPLRPEYDNRHIDRRGEAGLGFPVVRLHDTYSRRSFQRPFGHTINRQADKHITQRPEMVYEDDEAGRRMFGSE